MAQDNKRLRSLIRAKLEENYPFDPLSVGDEEERVNAPEPSSKTQAFYAKQFGSEFFVRFGRWKPDERSKIHLDRYSKDSPTHEAGVSAYEAKWRPDLNKWELDSDGMTWAGSSPGLYLGTMRTLINQMVRGRTKAYLIKGTPVDEGTDAEPILRNVRLVKELSCEDIYVSEYDFGRYPEDCSPKEGGI